MSSRAAVIATADLSLTDQVLFLLRETYDAHEIDLIMYPDLDIALAGDPFDEMMIQERFLRQEFALTAASRLVRECHSEHAILLQVLEPCPHARYYDNCEELLRLEMKTVLGWRLFKKVTLACLLPDLRIHTIE